MEIGKLRLVLNYLHIAYITHKTRGSEKGSLSAPLFNSIS